MAENKDKDIVMKCRHMEKVYPGTKALDDVDFNIYRGKVNVLIGENGAGKSTLMKQIAGIEQPSSGKMYLDGEEVSFKNTTEARAKGVGIIHQELSLFPNLNVYQNIFMNNEQKKGVVVNNEIHKQKTKEVLERLEYPIDPEAKVGDLRVGQQQMIEIARNLIQDDLKILIMDEPTSSLSQSEVQVLFKIMRELNAQGISIVYISHRHTKGYQNQIHEDRNHIDHIIRNRYMGPEHHHDHDEDDDHDEHEHHHHDHDDHDHCCCGHHHDHDDDDDDDEHEHHHDHDGHCCCGHHHHHDHDADEVFINEAWFPSTMTYVYGYIFDNVTALKTLHLKSLPFQCKEVARSDADEGATQPTTWCTVFKTWPSTVYVPMEYLEYYKNPDPKHVVSMHFQDLLNTLTSESEEWTKGPKVQQPYLKSNSALKSNFTWGSSATTIMGESN